MPVQPQTFRRKASTDIHALQWDGTEERADELWEWTGWKAGDAIGTRFVTLGDDTSYEILGDADDDDDIVRDGPTVQDRLKQGFTAALLVTKSGQWANLRTGDWVIAEPDGDGFYPCVDDVFTNSYELAAPPITESIGTGWPW